METQELKSGQREELDALLDRSTTECATQGEDIGELVVKIIYATDTREAKDDFEHTKRAEVDGLKNRNVWHVASSAEVSRVSNVLGG